MANNTNTPNNNQEGELDRFINDKNAKMNTFRNFFYNYCDTPAGSAFLRSNGDKAYSGAMNTNTLFGAYFDSLKKTHPYTNPTNGAGLTDQSKTDVQDNIATTNKDEFQSLIYSQYNLLLRQESHLLTKIESWYAVDTPHHLTRVQIRTEVAKLHLKDINTALYSPSRLTNLVNTWHKASTTHDYNFQGHKKKMIDDIAAITGIAANDANLVDIYNRITRDENASIANLEKILGNIDGLTPDQKFNILAIIKPTISLREYRTIAAKHNGGALKNDDEIVEDIINVHIAAPALTPDQKDRTKQRILDTIDRNGDNIHVPLSWIKDRRAADYLNLFQDVAEEAIGTIADKKKREETLEKFDQREIGAKHTERDKDIKVNLDDELESLKTQGEHDFARLKDAGIEADSHDQILDAFIKTLGDLGIKEAHKIKNLVNGGSTSSLYIIYRSGGINQYVEVKSYNGNATPIPTLLCVNHTDVNGEFYEYDKAEAIPIDKVAISLSRADRGEGGKDSFFTKGENGRVVEKSFVEDLVSAGKLKENIPDEQMKREDLEKKLFELDGEKNKLEPGLLIQTMDTQGKPMFVEVTAIDENTKTISINTTIDSTDATNIVHLQFHEFLGVFNRTQCKRVGLAKDIKTFIELCQKTHKPSEFANISLGKDGKLQYKNNKERADYIVGGFRTRGDKPNHIIINKISDVGVTFYYIEEGELEKDKDGKNTNVIKTKPKPKSIRTYENVSLKFLADQLNFLHDGDWQTFKDDIGEKEKEELEEEVKKRKREENHEHEHKPHYHGGPLQWMAHSKNFGHLFKGIGMAFGELKHFIEHGDEHVAKEMEYAFISWMRDTKGLKMFMPEEIYLDMKAEIESKKKKAIDELAEKWGGLSTGDCGNMASALLDDKHTTIEQMFGIIFGIHKKVGNLYSIPNLQSKRDQTHVDGIDDPVPIFLYKLCIIQGDDPVKMINELRKKCGKRGERAFEGGIDPVPEMYLIQVYSHTVLQNKNPPPVPGSFHAKIAGAGGPNEQEQKKKATDGEADMYSTQDQIESRMYALAKDGEIAQAIGFYERLIPRGAPMSTLMGLPFIVATTGLRDYMSNQLVRQLHVNGVYEQGFSSSMFTALETQDKYTNFHKLLNALAEKSYEINGEAILPDTARADLKKLLNDKFDDIPAVGRKGAPGAKGGKTILSQKVDLAQNFWLSYGKRLMQVLDGNDDNLLLLQQQKNVEGAEEHFKNTKERTEGRSFNANLTSWKNGHYNTDSTNYTLLNPKEAASSFRGVNPLTGKFKSDDNGQMDESIFMSFQQAFQRIKRIKNPEVQKDKFFEMHHEILKRIMAELSEDVIEKLMKTNNHPNWYSMLRRTIGFNIKNYNSSEVNNYSGFEDPTYRAKAQKELDFLLQGGVVNSVVGNVSGHAGATINPAFQ